MPFPQNVKQTFGTAGDSAAMNLHVDATQKGWGNFVFENIPAANLEVRIAEHHNTVVGGLPINTENFPVAGAITSNLGGCLTVDIPTLVGGPLTNDTLLLYYERNGAVVDILVKSATALEFVPGDPATYQVDFPLAEIFTTAGMPAITTSLIKCVRQSSLSPITPPVVWNTNIVYDLNNNELFEGAAGGNSDQVLYAFEFGEFIVDIQRKKIRFRNPTTYDVVHQVWAGTEDIISAYVYDDEIFVLAESTGAGNRSYVFKVDLNGAIVDNSPEYVVSLSTFSSFDRIMVKASGIYILGETAAVGGIGGGGNYGFVMRLDFSYNILQSTYLNVPDVFGAAKNSFPQALFEDSQGKVGVFIGELQRTGAGTFNETTSFVRLDDDLTILVETIYAGISDPAYPAGNPTPGYYIGPYESAGTAIGLWNANIANTNSVGFMPNNLGSGQGLCEFDVNNDYQIINHRRRQGLWTFDITGGYMGATSLYLWGDPGINFANQHNMIWEIDPTTLQVSGTRILYNDSGSLDMPSVQGHVVGMTDTRIYFSRPRWNILQITGANSSVYAEIGVYGELTRPIPFATTYLSQPDGITYEDGVDDDTAIGSQDPVVRGRVGAWLDFAPFLGTAAYVRVAASTTYDNNFLMSDVINTFN